MIRTEHLYKSFGYGEQKHAVLCDVELAVEDGSFTVILGASGSGKSTLLHCLSGLERPDSGSVFYDDRDIAALSERELTRFRRETVGFVFQQYFLLPHMSVDKNVRMGADLAGNRDYREIIRAVGLADKSGKYPGQLSGGEQQRVALARALAKKPRVLFLDEPTGALDEATGRQVLDYLARLHRELGLTLVMVTHNRNIADMADTVLMMNSGKLTSIVRQQTTRSAYEIGW